MESLSKTFDERLVLTRPEKGLVIHVIDALTLTFLLPFR